MGKTMYFPRKGLEMVDPEAVKVVYGIVGAVIGGGIVHSFKRYTESVDDQEKTLPVIVKSIETITTAINSINSSIQELYKCRNEHTEKLVKIETIHAIKGCDQKRRSTDNAEN